MIMRFFGVMMLMRMFMFVRMIVVVLMRVFMSMFFVTVFLMREMHRKISSRDAFFQTSFYLDFEFIEMYFV